MIKDFAITARIKNQLPITEKKIKNMINSIVSRNQKQLSSIDALIFKTLIDSNISHDEFVLANNVLKEHDNMKVEINILKLHKLVKTFNILINNVILFFEV